jgi:hypothetical protein
MDGMTPVPIGNPIAEEVFDNITDANLFYMWGVHDRTNNEIIWVDDQTSYASIRGFAWNYIDNVWSGYEFYGSATFPDIACGGNWTISNEDEVVLGKETGVCIYSEAYQGDLGTAMTCDWVTPILDFASQDPEAENRWITMYKVRVTFKNLSTDTEILVNYKKDGSDWAAWGNKTVGTADGRVNFQDFDNVVTGKLIQLKVYETSSTKKFQIEKIEIFYELGGEYYSI